MTKMPGNGKSMPGGEYQQDQASPATTKTTSAPTSSSKGRTFDGPFGGKSPQS